MVSLQIFAMSQISLQIFAMSQISLQIFAMSQISLQISLQIFVMSQIFLQIFAMSQISLQISLQIFVMSHTPSHSLHICVRYFFKSLEGCLGSSFYSITMCTASCTLYTMKLVKALRDFVAHLDSLFSCVTFLGLCVLSGVLRVHLVMA